MKRICPNPTPWNEAYQRLTAYSKTHKCVPPSPPTPLILAGWFFSNDTEKKHWWEKIIQWAINNGGIELISAIPDVDFYFAEKPTSYEIGPLGGPMYRAWDFESKGRPSPQELAQYVDILFSSWSEIVGSELASATHPLKFTGRKARRLIVVADAGFIPPWGSWSHLSTQETQRRTFTRFRAAINKAIAPHEVDHIDFTTGEKATQGAPWDES